jgi:hypothetical protein
MYRPNYENFALYNLQCTDFLIEKNAEQIKCAQKVVTWHSYHIFLRSEIILQCCRYFVSNTADCIRKNKPLTAVHSFGGTDLVSVLNNTDCFITKHVTAVRKVMGCRLHSSV